MASAKRQQFSYLYRPDEDAWRSYFMQMAEGKMNNGKRFTVLKSKHKDTSTHDTPQAVNLVSDAAQGLGIAKSELKEEEQQLNPAKSRPPRSYARAPPSKRRKGKVIKDATPDIFH